VLDESASMHKPAKATMDLNYDDPWGGAITQNDKTAWSAEELAQIKEETGLITRAEFEAMFTGEDREKNLEKASQLGYFIARDAGYGSDNTGKFLILQYVESEKSWEGWNVSLSYYPTHRYNEDKDAVRFKSISDLDDKYCRFYVTQYGVMYDAINDVAESLKKTDVDHRISIVGFAGPQHQVDRTNGLLSVRDNWDAIKTAIKTVNSNYDNTCLSGGIYKANKIFEANDIAGTNRERVMIIITDGEPNFSFGSIPHCEDPKDDAIYMASITKSKAQEGLGATVYSIGTAAMSDDNFLHYVSSEYPDAVDSDNIGARTEDIYCYTEEDAGRLDSIIKTITTEISTAVVELDETSILRDTISADFVLDEDKSKDRTIKVYTALYESGSSVEDFVFKDRVLWREGDTLESDQDEAHKLSVVRDGQIIEVKGFDYNRYHVNEGRAEGRKLIVRIPVRPSGTNSGGNDQYTNTEAEIEHNKEEVKEFPDPQVDIPTTVTIHKNVVGVDPAGLDFDFYVDYAELVGYRDVPKEDGSNHLVAIPDDVEDDNRLVTVAGNDSETVSDVIVGEKFVINEEMLSGYTVRVTVTIGDDPNDDDYYELQLGSEDYNNEDSKGIWWDYSERQLTIDKIQPNTEITFTNVTLYEMTSTGGPGIY